MNRKNLSNQAEPPLIGARAYDSDGLDDELKQDGVNMLAPHRSTRKLKTQDGRHLRRYERRWLVERFFAWLQWKRRLAHSRGVLRHQLPRLRATRLHHDAAQTILR